MSFIIVIFIIIITVLIIFMIIIIIVIITWYFIKVLVVLGFVYGSLHATLLLFHVGDSMF